MPSSATDTSIIPLLKRIFPKGIAWSGYEKSKLLGMMSKDTNHGGEGKYLVVSISPTEGGSSNYQTAYANQGPTQEKRFFVGHRTEYQLARIKNLAIAKTMGDRGAIKKIVEHTFTRAGYAFGRAMAARVWAGAGGMLFRCANSSTNTVTVTLANVTDMAKVEVGQWYQFATDDGTAASPAGVLDNGKQLQVVSKNPAAKTFDLSAKLNTVAGATTTMYVFRSGDYANCMTGMQGWAPIADPTPGESFKGLDRTVGDIQKLSGYRVTITGESKWSGISRAISEGQAVSQGDYKHAFWNPIDLNKFAQEIEAKTQVDVSTKHPGVGYQGIKTDTTAGPVVHFAEVDVPKGYVWIGNAEDMELCTAGECPRVLDFDGHGKLMRVAGEDAVQYDLGAYGDFCPKETSGPGNWLVVTL